MAIHNRLAVTSRQRLQVQASTLFVVCCVGWPTDHGWVVKRLDLTHVFILDFYGGAKPVSVEEYFAASV
jgi:hypothetical protein